MDQKELNVLVKRFLAGQCTEDEIKILNQWYGAFDTRESFINQISKVEKANLEKKLLEGIDAKIDKYNSQHQQRNVPGFTSHWYKVAACVAFLTTAYLVYFFSFNTTVKYTTPFAETKKIILPDSSSVVLNANSTLIYKSNWNSNKPREVWLEGEAFFEVQKVFNTSQLEKEQEPEVNHERVKFIVHTNNLDVEVLGTSFNVNHRRGKTQVVLNTGKVTIKVPDEQIDNISMKPGDLIELSNRNNVISKLEVDPKDYSAWQYKKLIFKRTPLSKVAEAFQDYYGVEMMFSDKDIKKRQVTGSIPIDNMDIFLEVLSESMRLDITRNRDKVWVRNTATIDRE